MRPIIIGVIAMLGAVGCTVSAPATPVGTPYPAGLWDAHVHLGRWGDDALDSLNKYGVVGVRDAGGDPALLKRWRAEIASGARRGPRIYFSGPHINGPRDDSTNRIIVRTAVDGERAVDSLAALGVDFIKTHTRIPPAAYFAVLRQAGVRGLKVMSHLPDGVPAWVAADSGVSDIEHMVESIIASPMSAGFVKTVEEAMDWWLSPAGDTMITHLARTRVVVTPTIVAYMPFVEMARNQEERDGRMRVYNVQKELTRRFNKAGIVILAGSDFATRDKGLAPGTSLLSEMRALAEAGLTPDEVRRAAGANIIAWLESQPKTTRRAFVDHVIAMK
jgi:hypothetical protein